MRRRPGYRDGRYRGFAGTDRVGLLGMFLSLALGIGLPTLLTLFLQSRLPLPRAAAVMTAAFLVGLAVSWLCRRRDWPLLSLFQLFSVMTLLFFFPYPAASGHRMGGFPRYKAFERCRHCDRNSDNGAALSVDEKAGGQAFPFSLGLFCPVPWLFGIQLFPRRPTGRQYFGGWRSGPKYGGPGPAVGKREPQDLWKGIEQLHSLFRCGEGERSDLRRPVPHRQAGLRQSSPR